MDRIAHIISGIFSPLWIPTYAMAVLLTTSYMVLVPLLPRIILLAVVLVITGIVPLCSLLVMKRMGLVGNIDVTDRTQRDVPIVIIGVCYMACSVFLNSASCPDVVVGMMRGAAVAVLVQLIVNRWWKISGHGAGTGALVAMMLREAVSMGTIVDMLWLVMAAVIVAGLTGTARLVLERHTLGQVIAGWANGFLWVWLFTMFGQNPSIV